MAYTTQTFPQHGGFSVLRFIAGLIVVTLVVVVAGAAVVLSPLSNNARALTFHSSVVDRGAVVTLAPGATASVTLRFRNAGFGPWERGVEGTQVDLGVKGDSLEFAKVGMAVGWLSDNRIATTTEPVVPPGADGTFTFTVRAPTTLGLYRIPVRLVVNNVTWLEDQDTFVVVASDFGFHDELVDQSRHPTLRVGETSGPITVKLRNTGTRAWVRGKADQQVNLGLDGGDATLKALALGWPSADRVAIQSETNVAPGDAATFTFRVRAPSVPGTYPLRLRPVVDGVTWLEGDSVLSLITVTAASGQAPQVQAGPTTFTSTASLAQETVAAGASASVSVSFQSASAARALLGVEIYAPGGGSLAYQKWFDEQTFAAGEQRVFPLTWQVPANAVLGTYSVSLRAFAPGWKSMYSSKDGAATLSVVAPVQSALPTAAPGGGGATAAPTAPGSSPAPSPSAPSFTSSAVITPGSVVVGNTVNVSTTFTSATATNALVSVEIYAPGAAIPVYQRSFDNQTFSAGQQRSYPMTWFVPSSAATGTYRVSLGVFSPGYGTQYSWTDSAATFAATAVPAPTATATAAVTASATTAPTATATTAPSATTAATASPTTAPTATPTSAPTATPAPALSFVTGALVAPANAKAGSPVTITANITSATATSALVDIVVYAPDGTTMAYQWYADNQTFTAGQSRSFVATWQVPSTAAAGPYSVSLGIFSPGWATLYSWKDWTVTFPIAAAAATPSPTIAPTATPASTTTPTPTTTPAPTATPAPTPTPATPPPGAPGFSALHVQGNKILNASGQTVMIRGVNMAGFIYACIQGWAMSQGPTTAASVSAMKSWKANAVRVGLNEDCWLGINGAPAAYSGANYQNAVKSYVSLLTQNSMYVILDLHWSAPGTQQSLDQMQMPNMDHSPAFWTSVATAFKGMNTVILEPYNEPYPDNNKDSTAAWTCWRDGGTCPGLAFQVAGMQTLVSTIRATGATNVIALGGVQWSNTFTRWLEFKPNDPLNNLVGSWHDYNWTWCVTVACYNSNVGAFAASVPVIADEVGNDQCDAVWMNTLLNWLESKQISYLGWTWNVWGAACSNIALIADDAGTPTTYGLIYKSFLAAH